MSEVAAAPPAPTPVEAAALLRHQPFRNYFAGRLMSELAGQMAIVAISVCECSRPFSSSG